jgi:hypothetical protein
VVVVVGGALVLVTGCGAPGDGRAVVVASTGVPATTAAPTTSTPPTTAPPTTPVPPPVAAPAPFDPRAVLEPLVIDDRPRPDRPYRRDEWPHWDDIDGNGCDERDDALLRTSLQPAATGPGCQVLSGSWVSPYDGVATTDPGAIQIDHLVPLANAFESGGWRWETARRRLFANDQQGLVPASAASNQAKGADTPDAWRPPDRGVWCAYAVAWVRVKVTYDLTATTRERDALGQMLDTCPPATPADAIPGGPGGAPSVVVPAPPPAPPPGDGGGSEVYFANCAAARAVGAAPILRGEPGYRERLDGDGDGVACE